MEQPLVGTLINNRYLVEEEIGTGGFGSVYLARDTQLLNRRVAVKVLHGQSARDEWFQRKFAQEIEALARIHHPGVVSVIDAGELPDGLPFMVQQFVEGKTLRAAISGGGMDLVRAAGIIRRIGLALTAAHEKGVIHRDLKPENVMLQEGEGTEEHVTLIDFGISSIADDPRNELATKVTGTFTYMAPEQFDGKPVAASDIYSLAVIAFEMLAGAPPASGKPLFELMLMQKEGNWPRIHELRPSVPPAVSELLSQGLAYRAEDRSATARDLGGAVADALLGGLSDPVVPPPPATRRPSIGRWAAWSGGTLLLAAALAIYLERSPTFLQPSTLPVPLPQAAIRPERAFSYWITGRHSASGRAGERRFVVARETAFRTGDEINIEIELGRDGFLYAINQAPELRDGLPVYSVLFPSLRDKEARVEERQYLKIPEGEALHFTGPAGMEYVWLVLAQQPVAALDGLRPDAKLRRDQAQLVNSFLELHAGKRAPIETDNQAVRSVVAATGDITLVRLELSHRR